MLVRITSQLGRRAGCCRLFFFNDTATTEIYTLSLHDALPIFEHEVDVRAVLQVGHVLDGRNARDHALVAVAAGHLVARLQLALRSEEHTSELQSRQYLVCRLLLEKKSCNGLRGGRRGGRVARL